jgi:hypothetical protein
MHRIRSYFTASGMTTRQAALAAGVNWRTAKKVLEEDGNPELATIRKFELLVPESWSAPPLPEGAPSEPSARIDSV